MSKQVFFKEQAVSKLTTGIEIVARAVASTLGPKGRNVIIEKPYQSPHVTKDGVTVAKEISLVDPVENMGAEIIKQAALSTAEVAGDGTSTSTVIAEALIRNTAACVASGSSPVELKKGIERGLKEVLSKIDSMSENIELSSEQVEQVATVSANNDPELGAKIAKAIRLVGEEGIVLVEESRNVETTVDHLFIFL